MKENKKPVLILTIILLASLIYISFFTKKKADKTTENIKRDRILENLPQGVSLIKAKEKEELPQGFPEVPLNGKKEIMNSYTLAYAGLNQDQKTVDFISSVSVKQNFDFYKNWAEKNKFKILYSTNNNDKEAKIIIEKNERPIYVSIIKHPADPEISKVNINY